MYFPFSDLEEELLEEDWLSGKKVKEKKNLTFTSTTPCVHLKMFFCLEAGKYGCAFFFKLYFYFYY